MREEAYSALFALLNPLVGTIASGKPLRVTSRRLEFAEDVPAENTPGVWQLQLDESPHAYSFGGIAAWQLNCDWYIYVTQNNETAPSTPIINPVLDAVMNVLPLSNNVDGGIGFSSQGNTCAIMLRDPIRYWEGLLNNKAVVQIPLRILVPLSGT